MGSVSVALCGEQNVKICCTLKCNPVLCTHSSSSNRWNCANVLELPLASQRISHLAPGAAASVGALGFTELSGAYITVLNKRTAHKAKPFPFPEIVLYPGPQVASFLPLGSSSLCQPGVCRSVPDRSLACVPRCHCPSCHTWLCIRPQISDLTPFNNAMFSGCSLGE